MAIQNHLELCITCRNIYDTNKGIKKKLNDLNQLVPVPQSLGEEFAKLLDDMSDK